MSMFRYPIFRTRHGNGIHRIFTVRSPRLPNVQSDSSSSGANMIARPPFETNLENSFRKGRLL